VCSAATAAAAAASASATKTGFYLTGTPHLARNLREIPYIWNAAWPTWYCDVDVGCCTLLAVAVTCSLLDSNTRFPSAASNCQMTCYQMNEMVSIGLH
jgi:hypothetical protein